MKRLLYSGLLYLLGVSVVLYFKPDIMFNQDGEWKEFGLGRNPEQYTWLPFWLFTVLWAIISYLIVLILLSASSSPSASSDMSLFSDTGDLEPENVSIKPLSSSIKRAPSNTGEMKKGYYMLDANETAKRGIPKYIYLGPDAPNFVHHDE